MSKFNTRILLLFLAVIILTAAAIQAVAATYSTTVTVPLIDTNVPLYVLVDGIEIDTTSLGALIIIR